MKILHTGDWHLGQLFYQRSRKEEHKLFLDWLLEIIEKEKINVLIVAGDIFDTTNPPDYALTLYYSFLADLTKKTRCSEIVIIAGNHDSISTLEAPKNLLKNFNIHVITDGENMDEGIIKFYGEDKTLQGIICAVPFLRDRVVKNFISGENFPQAKASFEEGIKKYYNDIYQKAVKISENSSKIPILGTGHLTTKGSVIGDKEREIYIGNLESIDDSLFQNFDYTALGHLHKSQLVGKHENIRYSGTPFPMSFDEAKYDKFVLTIEFDGKKPKINEILVPRFRNLKSIKTNKEDLQEKLNSLNLDKKELITWVEILLEGNFEFNLIQKKISEICDNLNIEVLAFKDENIKNKKVLADSNIKRLDSIDPESIFKERISEELLGDEGFIRKLENEYKNILSQVLIDEKGDLEQ